MREEAYVGHGLTTRQIRDERLKVSVDLLQLALRDIAVLPTAQQEDVREAVLRLQRVQEWCASHRDLERNAP